MIINTDINYKQKPAQEVKSVSFTIESSAWNSEDNTAEITFDDDNIYFLNSMQSYINLSDTCELAAKAAFFESKISIKSIEINKIIFSCVNIPTEDIPMILYYNSNVIISNDGYTTQDIATSSAQDTNTTYTLTAEGDTLTLTGSDGNNSSVTISTEDTDTTYSAGNGLVLNGTEFSLETIDELERTSEGTIISSGNVEVLTNLWTDDYGRVTEVNSETISLQGTIYTAGAGIGISTDNVISIAGIKINGADIIDEDGNLDEDFTTPYWGQYRNITIGNSTKAIDGHADVSYTLDEILGTVTKSTTTSTVYPAHTENFTAIDSITTDDYGRVTEVNTKTIILPEDTNTDTMVTNTLATTTKAYITGTTSTETNTGTQVFDTGVYLGGTAGALHANTLYASTISSGYWTIVSNHSDNNNNKLTLTISDFIDTDFNENEAGTSLTLNGTNTFKCAANVDVDDTNINNNKINFAGTLISNISTLDLTYSSGNNDSQTLESNIYLGIQSDSYIGSTFTPKSVIQLDANIINLNGDISVANDIDVTGEINTTSLIANNISLPYYTCDDEASTRNKTTTVSDFVSIDNQIIILNLENGNSYSSAALKLTIIDKYDNEYTYTLKNLDNTDFTSLSDSQLIFIILLINSNNIGYVLNYHD